MKERSLFWIIGFLVYFSGVASPVTVTIAPRGSTTSTHSISTYIIDIKITNRIYNDSLTDQQSMPYKILRREVENVFHNTYSQNPSLQYEGITEMKFSNGSVIATSTALFAGEEINPSVVKNEFVFSYQRNPSVTLDLNLDFMQDHEATHETLHLEKQTTPHSLSTTTTTPFTHSSSHFSTHSTTLSSAHLPTHSPSHSATHSSAHTTTNSSAHSSAHLSTHSPSHSATHSPSNSATHSSTHSSTHSPSHSTTHSSAHSLTHPATISSSHSSTEATSHTSPQSQDHTSVGPISSTPSHLFNISGNDTHTTTNSSSKQNITARPVISSSTAVHPTAASNHSDRPGGNVSEKPSGPGGSGTTHKPQSNAGSTSTESAAQQGVPGWGVALLVLAAIILFLLLLLFILLLLCWCCWWRRRGFMNVSDPDPPGYYNPDIPMYSTHSTYDTHNGKSPQDSDFEKPPKNRTGMYVVNN